MKHLSRLTDNEPKFACNESKGVTKILRALYVEVSAWVGYIPFHQFEIFCLYKNDLNRDVDLTINYL